MERCQRLRVAVASLQPRAVIETGIRLLVASAVNYYISHSFFDQRLIPIMDSTFKASSLSGWDAFRIDTQRMTKMQKLWPPHAHFELAAVFTIFLYILLKCFLRPENFLEVISSLCKRSHDAADDQREAAKASLSTRFALRLLSAAVAAFSLFTLLLPMQRLAEMHIFVISLNFIHMLVICELTALIMFFCSEHDVVKMKKE